MDTETGELKEQRLAHREEAKEFYRALVASGEQVRVGMEASGHARFERLLAEVQAANNMRRWHDRSLGANGFCDSYAFAWERNTDDWRQPTLGTAPGCDGPT